MQGDDQERFEDYLELEQFIEELQAGHAAHPPTELTPEKANIYRMAALFRSASPDAAEPRPEFAADLYARLTEEMKHIQEERAKSRRFPFLRKRQEQAGGQRTRGTSDANGKKPVSRRALLAGGAAVAASLVAGAGIMHEVDQAATTPQVGTGTPPSWSEKLIAADQPSTWLFVTTLAELGDKVVRFASDTIVGYVTLDGTKGDADEGKVVAMSAACTHMGCIVQWQASEQKFVCPCHGGLFTEYGKPDPQSPLRYLSALPRLDTKVENGKVYVKVPDSGASPPAGQPKIWHES